MCERDLDQLCLVALRVEEQATTLRKLGFDEIAYLLEMAVLDLNRQVYECRGGLGMVPANPPAPRKESRH
jgi:hypothetical protein